MKNLSKLNKLWQNRWVCPSCGRFYTLKQIGNTTSPNCYICGKHLRPWQETSNWMLFLVGFVVFPALGYLLATGAERVGLNTEVERQITFCLIPALLLIIDIPAYYVGLSTGNGMMKRGGIQGLIMVFGFLVSTFFLIIAGYYGEVIGIK